eukprot:TRINITY_DN6831_c0_g1_i1.p1 TRINITY_DN6831_c0_g1~~TRINITY_DN6831_c0_g1_i1.p1  ORF type:complete len:278 (+),score=41.62 TRINITY_DN6831_c0_g1_i1:248-1081(+)
MMDLGLVFSLLLLVVGAYDVDRAKMFADFTGAAYCSGNVGQGVKNWDCDVCRKYPGVSATEVSDNETNANGFVAYNPNNKEIVISFCGTDPLSIKDWIDDIDTIQIDYDACNDCKVHRGFYLTYLSVKPQVLSALDFYLATYPTSPVTVTGHSLGAALAVHCAIDLKLTKKIGVLELYNFGQPRVGNIEFAQFYVQQVATNWRVTHWRDPVPHLPLEDWSFHQQFYEVFYDQPQTSYTICDKSGEDPSCSDRFSLDLRVDDHLNYVGFDYLTNYLSC